MIKTILCTGDSHTWGQGIAGVENDLTPPGMAGDLRLGSFHYGSYVNLLRQMINEHTHSVANEIKAEQLCREEGIGLENGCAVIGEKPLVLTLDADLLRIEFFGQLSLSKAEIWIDGKLERDINLQVENPINAYQIDVFFCHGKGAHRLEVKSASGSVMVYRIEAYRGQYAVLNCGIGSCSVLRYMTEYWDDYVTAYHPSIVVMEPHTINDWLDGAPPVVYQQRVQEMIRRFKTMDAVPILLTVSPIEGAQSEPYNRVDYTTYIRASLSAAKECDIPIADSHAVMLEKLNGLTQEQQYSLLYHDPWHVNDFGHQIYAQVAFDALIKNHII